MFVCVDLNPLYAPGLSFRPLPSAVSPIPPCPWTSSQSRSTWVSYTAMGEQVLFQNNTPCPLFTSATEPAAVFTSQEVFIACKTKTLRNFLQIRHVRFWQNCKFSVVFRECMEAVCLSDCRRASVHSFSIHKSSENKSQPLCVWESAGFIHPNPIS